ncbi:MAG: diguanylate cyclase [Sandaracinaceae bacterium]|nr:diguanylate cyclase [Sandaracinaceae bacterium]
MSETERSTQPSSVLDDDTRKSVPDAEPLAAPLDILVVDDDEASRAILEIAVTSYGHRCRTACDGQEAWELYQAEPAQVILSDWNMPRMDGAELCRRVRGASGHSYTYFIFMTSFADREHFLRGMAVGADDYQTKPVDLDELSARLHSAERVLSVYRSLADSNRTLRHDSERATAEARVDPLTGLPNRLRLNEDLEDVRANMQRFGDAYCVALCDIDNFKQFNDRFGHPSGDIALRSVAETLRRHLREVDMIYRYGGEEFLLVFAKQGAESATAALDRVRKEVAAAEIRILSGEVHSLTISAGLTAIRAPADVQAAIERADAALYRAKACGKNQVVSGQTHIRAEDPRALADIALGLAHVRLTLFRRGLRPQSLP